ncbi:hypothetical protein FQR65_LT02602 [Abscondita terminalis]|nr:hypothetical protein FQR65_LT02602 [Abscondita terminalis]
MGTFFSQGLALLNDINVCADRIGKFLLLDEVVKDKRFSENIELKNVTAKWSRTKENTLSDINVRIEKGSLVAVVGAVGSGKSSLLLSLLSEIPITSGDALLNGTVSYSSQDPWIFNSSIRRNILFGNKINVERYKEVINVCDLAKDLKMFSSGDRTMVGEYGSVLSGGQKARVNLARALYQDADIYLLDDPLSAVDVNVGKKIFRDCVRGFLKNKTVILVTHQLQYLQQVDRILVLESGKIKADGTFEELQKSNLNFVQLLHREDADDNDDSKDNSSIELTKQIPARVREHSSKSVSSISGYIKYASASGSKILVSAVIFLFILVQFLFSGSFYLMTYWVNYEQALAYNSSYYITDDDVIKSQNHFVIIYSSVTAALLVTTLLRNTLLFNFCMKSSINLHKSMFESMVRASMTFFNNNGPGRILNRFTKDMGVVDELLPLALAIAAQTLFSIIGIFVMTSIINFWMVIPNIVALIIFNYINIFTCLLL